MTEDISVAAEPLVEERCQGCGGDAGDNWFDRSLCPCADTMHTRCRNCGHALDGCEFEQDKPPSRYEHTDELRKAQEAVVAVRKHTRRLHWMSGGGGYDNMGERELDQVRVKVDELDFWLAAASRSLNAGGKRAVAEGFWPPKTQPAPTPPPPTKTGISDASEGEQ